MTGKEYLGLCKSRTLDYINRGTTEEGLIYLLNALGKHEETKGTKIVEDVVLELNCYKSKSIAEIIKFIRELRCCYGKES